MSGWATQFVSYKIDDQPVRVEQWRLSTDGRTVGVWGVGARELLRRFNGKRSLWIRASSQRGQIEANFDLSGIEHAVQPVVFACRLPR